MKEYFLIPSNEIKDVVKEKKNSTSDNPTNQSTVSKDMMINLLDHLSKIQRMKENVSSEISLNKVNPSTSLYENSIKNNLNDKDDFNKNIIKNDKNTFLENALDAIPRGYHDEAREMFSYLLEKKFISIENNTGDVETINGNKIRIGSLLKTVFVRRAKVSDNYDALIDLKDKIPKKFIRNEKLIDIHDKNENSDSVKGGKFFIDKQPFMKWVKMY